VKRKEKKKMGRNEMKRKKKKLTIVYLKINLLSVVKECIKIIWICEKRQAPASQSNSENRSVLFFFASITTIPPHTQDQEGKRQRVASQLTCSEASCKN
jgi:flagellar basal body-associated protein FliL